MTTDYDPIAELYKLSKEQPWRTYVESFSLMQLIGDPAAQSVLDVACGEGFYTRMLRQKGAAKVTGVDLSAGMIDLARQQEDAAPAGHRVHCRRLALAAGRAVRRRGGRLFAQLRPQPR